MSTGAYISFFCCLFIFFAYFPLGLIFSPFLIYWSLNITEVSIPSANQGSYIRQNCPSKVREKSRHSQTSKSWESSATTCETTSWALSMSISRVSRMQSGQWLNSTTAGSTTGRLYMLSYLLSSAIRSHAFGVQDGENVPLVAPATSCTWDLWQQLYGWGPRHLKTSLSRFLIP